MSPARHGDTINRYGDLVESMMISDQSVFGVGGKNDRIQWDFFVSVCFSVVKAWANSQFTLGDGHHDV